MPVPVSVTGFTNQAGAQSSVQTVTTSKEIVSEGPFARAAQAPSTSTPTPAAKPAPTPTPNHVRILRYLLSCCTCIILFADSSLLS